MHLTAAIVNRAHSVEKAYFLSLSLIILRTFQRKKAYILFMSHFIIICVRMDISAYSLGVCISIWPLILN